MTFVWNENEHVLRNPAMSFWGYGGTKGNVGYGLYFWEQRQGRTWQKDIEAHVAKYEKEVLPYSTKIEYAWRVIEKLIAEGYDWELYPNNIASDRDNIAEVTKYINHQVMLSTAGISDTMSIAICNAAIQVRRKEERLKK